MKSRMIVVTHPPKLPNPKAEELKAIVKKPAKKPLCVIDKKPI